MAPGSSVDELLVAAHEQVWAWARSMPADPADRFTAAHGGWRDVTAAWSPLAASVRHALAAVSYSSGYRARLDPFLERLAVVEHEAGREGPRGGESHLVRAAALVGAAGDLLTTTAHNPLRGDVLPADRVASLVEAAARLTASQLEISGSRGLRSVRRAQPWVALAAAAGAAVEVPAAHALPPRVQPQVPRVHEATLAGGVSRWRVAAEAAATASPHPAGDLPLVAYGIALLHTAAVRADTSVGSAARAGDWVAAARVWPRSVRLLAPPAPGLREATAQLRGHLGAALHTADQAPVREVLADALASAEPIGQTYAATVQQSVGSQIPVVAARAYLESERAHHRGVEGDIGAGGVDLRLAGAEAARRGRWMPLPPSSAIATGILEATRGAAPADAAPVPDVPRLLAVGEHLERPRPDPARVASHPPGEDPAGDLATRLARGLDKARAVRDERQPPPGRHDWRPEVDRRPRDPGGPSPT